MLKELNRLNEALLAADPHDDPIPGKGGVVVGSFQPFSQIAPQLIEIFAIPFRMY